MSNKLSASINSCIGEICQSYQLVKPNDNQGAAQSIVLKFSSGKELRFSCVQWEELPHEDLGPAYFTGINCTLEGESHE